MANFQKTKKGNTVHRTTSETLRLGDDVLNNSIRVITQGHVQRKKGQLQATSPNCSFQIIGVSLTRCDYGDDSADDLDESHTDDISRITDNETPSFSEDSKDIDDHQQFVFPSTAVSLHSHSLLSSKNAKREVDQPKVNKTIKQSEIQIGRFKVTKIESLPINRGRWTCVDYKEETESAFQSALLICDNRANVQQSGILQGINNPLLTEDDSSNKNNQLDDQPKITNNSTSNCQESYYYSGSIVMPNNGTTDAIPLTVESPQKKMKPQQISVVLQNTDLGQIYGQQLLLSDPNKNSSSIGMVFSDHNLKII